MTPDISSPPSMTRSRGGPGQRQSSPARLYPGEGPIRYCPRARPTKTGSPPASASCGCLSGSSPWDKVLAYVQRRRSAQDAQDIVSESVVSVCVAHGRTGYSNLGAALWKAAVRRATRWGQRGRRECPLVDEPMSCDSLPDEGVRFEIEDEALFCALSAERDVVQSIIRARVFDGEDFASIGARYGLTADQARTEFNNAMRRMRKKLDDGCPQ